MTFDDYLLHLFYLVDAEYEALRLGRLRRRGPPPVLHDAEVLTMELAGEFLGLDTDAGIYAFFRRYHRPEFPALARVHRTTFVRQAAALWRAARRLHERLVDELPLRDEVSGEPLRLIDSFPLHVCRSARSKGSSSVQGQQVVQGPRRRVRARPRRPRHVLRVPRPRPLVCWNPPPRMLQSYLLP